MQDYVIINKSMPKQISTIIIIALIFFGLGFFGNNYYKSTTDDTYQSGWDAAKLRLEQSGFMPMLGEDMEITSISGIVEEIQNNKISLKISPLEPLADSDLDNRTIEVDENTKIYQLTEKDPAEYQKEMDEFNKQMEEQMENPEEITEMIMLPEMYIEQEINLTDIQAGDRLTATAQEDIREVKEFKVIEIIVQ